MFQRCDLDGDGRLSYTEFTALMFRQKDRLELQKEERIKGNQRRKESKPKTKLKNKGKKK